MLVAGQIGQLSQKYMLVAGWKMADFSKGGCWRKHRLKNRFPKKETRGVTLECTGGGLLTGA